jgi:hypothetical protein
VVGKHVLEARYEFNRKSRILSSGFIPFLGLAITFGAGVANAALGWFLIRTGKSTQSLTSSTLGYIELAWSG